MRKISFQFLALAVLLSAALASPANALQGVYLGAEVGDVALGGTLGQRYNNAIGYGANLGLRANWLLDAVFRFQHSSHAGGAGLELSAITTSADFHVLQINDFDFSLGAGPGFYFFSAGPVSETDFGINFGANGDVHITDGLQVGLGWRYNAVFNGSANLGNSYWAAMFRIGYYFETN